MRLVVIAATTLVALCGMHGLSDPAHAQTAEFSRVARGLEALYLFQGTAGATVQDHSGKKPPLDLHIEDLSSVRREPGRLAIEASVAITSTRDARRLHRAARHTGELTVEAWLHPANAKQSGPARIVSFSQGASRRNFTLGQDAAHYDVRLRTRKTDQNGLPSTRTQRPAVQPRLTHVVYTRDRTGRARVYVDGRVARKAETLGDFSNWDKSYRLILANEHGGSRPWLGELHLVALYSVALTPAEVRQNFAAGAASAPHAPADVPDVDPLFATKVAPLLAQRCLKCHDAAVREGGLDLSDREAATTGGDSGSPWIAGDAASSLLWQRVDSDEMPPEEPPLSADEKQLLKTWIAGGGQWTLERIDPVLYVRGESTTTSWVQRLTVPEYIATVQAVTGVDIGPAARELLPADVRADGFSNTAYNLTVDLEHIEVYSRLAEKIVEQMDVAAFGKQFAKSRSISNDRKTRELAARIGQRIFRGPLENREINLYAGMATTTAAAGGGFEEAVAAMVEAMLQSPRFLYRIEDRRGDGSKWPVADHELASRLSYIVWGAPPDDELYRAAEAGSLQDRDLLGQQVERMLEDPRAVARSIQFIVEWLALDRLDDLQPDPTRFPDWNPQLARDMRAETIAYFEELTWEQRRPLADLFNAQFTYATPELARHYGLSPRGSGLARYDLADNETRGGLLTHGSVLTRGGDDASMVTRGLFVLHEVLRGTVHDPPPGLDTTPVPPEPGRSRREVAAVRVASESCGGCHRRFEPLAYGLERYDGIGRYAEQDEHGNPQRSDGEVLVPGASTPLPYTSSSELMDLLAGSDRVRETLTWKLVQFALGRLPTASEAPLVDQVHAEAREDGGTYHAVITALCTSELVTHVQTISFDPSQEPNGP